MEKVPMTARGEKLLREELDRLLKLRPKITEALELPRTFRVVALRFRDGQDR